MKPIALSGHTRSLTQLKYNREGDLLFSVSKDSKPSVWWSHNGERLGSLEGHKGACWTVDPRYDSTLCLTGSADNTMKMWDVEYGKVVVDIEDKSPIRTVGWSYSGEKFFYSTDKAMGQKCALKVFTLGAAKTGGADAEPFLTIPCHESKVTSAIWGPLDETIITGHENGDLIKWDSTTGEEVRRVKHFKSNINDLQYNADCSMFISASKDTSCKVFDVDELEVLKEWKTERPVNSAAFSPIRDHVVMGGGQDAMSVTTTSTKVGKFDAAFYHLIYEEELGRVKGHFGPINTLAFNPTGKQYASGGEDGYIRIHDFDPSYFQFEFEVGAH